MYCKLDVCLKNIVYRTRTVVKRLWCNIVVTFKYTSDVVQSKGDNFTDGIDLPSPENGLLLMERFCCIFAQILSLSNLTSGLSP